MLSQLRPFLRGFRYITAYQRFMHAYIGIKAGLFDLLSQGVSLDGLINEHGNDRDLLEIWLKIAVHQGLIRENAGRYTLTKKGAIFTSSSPTYTSTFILLQADYWSEAYRQFPELMKTHARITIGGPEFDTLVAGLSRTIEPLAFRILRKLPQAKKPGARFLDLGCGLGSFLIYLTQINTTLQAVGVELAGDVAASAKNTLAKQGLTERVRIIQGDVRTVELDGAFDLCNFSQIYYYLTTEEKLQLFRRVKDHLTDQGVLAILVPLLSESQRSRADFFPLLFQLYQSTQTNLHGIPAKQEVYTILRNAGFTQIKTRRLAPIGLPYYYFIASKTA